MKYKYRVFYELEPEHKRPPDGWYCIYRKPAGMWGFFNNFWSYVCLGSTLDDAYKMLEQILESERKPTKILIKEWVEE